jgi:hypothetical protein
LCDAREKKIAVSQSISQIRIQKLLGTGEEGATNLWWENLVIALLIKVGGFVRADNDSVEPFDPAGTEVAGDDYPEGAAMVRAQDFIIHLCMFGMS